jgi:hypothetical protein
LGASVSTVLARYIHPRLLILPFVLFLFFFIAVAPAVKSGQDLKLNETSVLLEVCSGIISREEFKSTIAFAEPQGSRATSNGARVGVNLSETSVYSLFPGQVAAACVR